MATTKPKETDTKETTNVEATKYDIKELEKKCVVLFGVTTSTFVGATAGLSGSYTVDEVKSILEKWLKKEVKA